MGSRSSATPGEPTDGEPVPAIARELGARTLAAEIDPDDQATMNALLDEAISVSANGMDFVERLAALGVTTVVMDRDGRLVRQVPDGSRTFL